MIEMAGGRSGAEQDISDDSPLPESSVPLVRVVLPHRLKKVLLAGDGGYLDSQGCGGSRSDDAREVDIAARPMDFASLFVIDENFRVSGNPLE